MLGRGRVGARDADRPGRLLGQRGPDLLAGQPPAPRRYPLRAGGQPGQVEPAPGSLNSWHQTSLAAQRRRAGTAPAAPAVPYWTRAGTTHAPMTSAGRAQPGRLHLLAMMSCSSGSAPRPHGRGRCGVTQPPAASRSVAARRGLAPRWPPAPPGSGARSGSAAAGRSTVSGRRDAGQGRAGRPARPARRTGRAAPAATAPGGSRGGHRAPRCSRCRRAPGCTRGRS